MDNILTKARSALGLHHSNDTDTDTQDSPFTVLKLLRSYIGDWILVVVLYFSLGTLYQYGGHKREFSLTDITIQRPMISPETVPSGMLGLISVGVPVLFIVVIGAIMRNRWDIHNGVLGEWKRRMRHQLKFVGSSTLPSLSSRDHRHFDG